MRKRLTVNGVARRTSSLAEVARVVLFRPEEMLLLVGSPGDRRRFLDGIMAQRDRRAARDLVDVARVVAQRNALLRAIRAEEAPLDALAFWDEQLAQLGARVMRARLEVLAELIGAHRSAARRGRQRRRERGADVGLALPRRAQGGLAGADRPDRAHPARRRAGGRLSAPDRPTCARRRRGTASAWSGPQRDDLRAALGGRDVAAHASRGQQRTIILAMKLAETDLLGADGPTADRAARRRVQRAGPRPGRSPGRPADRARPGDRDHRRSRHARRRRDGAMRPVWRIVDGALEPEP